MRDDTIQSSVIVSTKRFCVSNITAEDIIKAEEREEYDASSTSSSALIRRSKKGRQSGRDSGVK